MNSLNLSPLARGLLFATIGGCCAVPISVVPAVIMAVLFLCVYGEERFVRYAERETMESVLLEIEKLRTQVSALNFKLGMGPMPKK